jgi:hypothetical protein
MSEQAIVDQLSTLSSQLAELRSALRAPIVTDRILTLEEAIPYTKHESSSAFYRWCSRLRVTSARPGRFARSVLDSALEREAARRRQPKSAPRRPEKAA